MPSLADLKIKIWADTANREVAAFTLPPFVTGITTNPSLLRKAGVLDYAYFGRRIVQDHPDLSISLEVLADDLATMEQQAYQIARWGENVYVKIPVMTSSGEKTLPIIRRLHRDGIKLNITAVFTIDQVERITLMLDRDTPNVISIFAGRIADTGVDPCDVFGRATGYISPMTKLLWASTREVWNIWEAQACGADIITLAPELIQKLDLLGKDLTEYSRETVAQFVRDAAAAGLSL